MKGKLLKLIIPALLVYALCLLFVSAGRLNLARQELDSAREKLESLESRESAQEREIAALSDPEELTCLARQRLGLILPGDRAVYDLGK